MGQPQATPPERSHPTSGIARRPRVLVVEDERDTAEVLGELLDLAGYRSAGAGTPEEARRLVREFSPDVVLCDVVLPGSDGLTLAAEIRRERPTLPVVAMTGYASVDVAVRAFRLGLADFLVKPVAMADLDDLLRRILHTRTDLQNLVGSSPAMRRLREEIARLAPTRSTLLIQGESGTGKELVARAVHESSQRREGPLVSVNCAAIAPTLMESELFGHVAGAFTDASSDRPGLFVEADGGTLFLDEIGELPLGLQPKLLRALQERRIRPVGGFDERSVDVRIIAATRRNLADEVAEGRFRSDLYYRLNVIRIEVPPLRDRRGDVIELAELFLKRLEQARGRPLPRLGDEVRAALRAHDWPGNVRELQNCLERVVTLSRGDEVELESLPSAVRRATELPATVVSPDEEEEGELLSLRQLERRYVEHVLRLKGGNKTAAARVLGVDRRTLRRMLQRWAGTPE